MGKVSDGFVEYRMYLGENEGVKGKNHGDEGRNKYFVAAQRTGTKIKNQASPIGLA